MYCTYLFIILRIIYYISISYQFGFPWRYQWYRSWHSSLLWFQFLRRRCWKVIPRTGYFSGNIRLWNVPHCCSMQINDAALTLLTRFTFSTRTVLNPFPVITSSTLWIVSTNCTYSNLPRICSSAFHTPWRFLGTRGWFFPLNRTAIELAGFPIYSQIGRFLQTILAGSWIISFTICIIFSQCRLTQIRFTNRTRSTLRIFMTISTIVFFRTQFIVWSTLRNVMQIFGTRTL